MAVTYMVLPLLPGQKVARVMAVNAGPALPVSSHGLMLVTGGDTAVDVDDAHPFPIKVVATSVGSILDTDNAAIVSLNSKYMANGSAVVTPKFAKIAASLSGDNTLVAAVTSKKLRVFAYNFLANGTVNGKFQSGAGGTDLTGLKYLVANAGLVAPFNPLGWFETAAGALLNLNLSGAIAVGGELVYGEI